MTETAVGREAADPRRHVNACPECGQRFGVDGAFCPFDGTKLALTERRASADEPLEGAVIEGRYEVLRLLGEGGMGTVYEVRHTALARSFAMKVLRRDVAKQADLAARFTHEAHAMARLRHPHVVSITDFGALPGGAPYFVMELLVGQTLAAAIHTGIAFRRALQVMLQMASALSAAHEAGIVHRDLKPENVFLSRARGPRQVDVEDDVKILDFGAARVLGASRITKAGVVFGTPHYMSPEQASGHPVDHRSDIYAFGVIMYEMLTGRVPFEADTYMGVLTQHMFVLPPPPSTLRPELGMQPGSLESIVLRALEKLPVDRYQTMSALAADLEAAARGARVVHGERPSVASRPPSSPRALATSTARSRELAVAGLSPRLAPRAVAFGIAAGVAAVALVALWRASTRTTPGPGGATVGAATPTTMPSVATAAPAWTVVPPPVEAPWTPVVDAGPADAVFARPASSRSAPPRPGHAAPRRAGSGELSDPWAR